MTDTEISPRWFALGFDVISTGGGCTALSRGFSGDTYILVTEDISAMAPTRFDESVRVGFYAPDDWQDDPVWEFRGQQGYTLMLLERALNPSR